MSVPVHNHVFLFAPPWGPVEHRPHHLMRAIVRLYGGRVLYVEDVGIEIIQKVLAVLRLLRKIDKNLYAMRTFPIFSESHSPLAAGINRRMRSFIVKLVSKILDMKDIVLWHWPGHSYRYIGILGEKLNVYDSAGEISLYNWPTSQVRENEKNLLQKVDLVFVATEPLRKITEVDNPHSYVIAQAVDPKFYLSIVSKTLTEQPELATLSRPILGFTGNIHEWIDCDLLRQVALQRPNWQIVLIGPVREVGKTKEEIAKLQGLPNIHLLGSRAYAQLPGYMAWFDVCLIPYKLTEITEVSETVKFYEYLACGKPIVSTQLPPLKKWSDVVYLAGSPKEFIDMVEMALDEPSSKSIHRRELAQKNTWDIRIETAMRLIHEAWIRRYGL